MHAGQAWEPGRIRAAGLVLCAAVAAVSVSQRHDRRPSGARASDRVRSFSRNCRRVKGDQRAPGARSALAPRADAAAVALRHGVTPSYLPPALLSSDHGVDGFECRSREQTQWLRRRARQSAATGATGILVVTPTNSTEVVAYYAWSMAAIAVQTAPPRLRKGAGERGAIPSQSPCWLAWE